MADRDSGRKRGQSLKKPGQRRQRRQSQGQSSTEPGQRGQSSSTGQRNIFLVLAYDGTDFSGWQRLGGGARTVQKTLEDALSGMLGERINVVGSGRTDAGVHADGQAANFWTQSALSPATIAVGLNDVLPPDLACIGAREAVSGFHARYRAVAKTYAYRFHDGCHPDPFARRWSLHVATRLDERAIASALAVLPGERDFRALSNAKDDARGFVRKLASVDVERRGDLVEVSFTADGFLYNQARVMAGCAFEAGLGQMDAATLSVIFEAGNRDRAPGALGAFGLRLVKVDYRAEDFTG
jgi:tRNA pseudouridine38-40 synthase